MEWENEKRIKERVTCVCVCKLYAKKKKGTSRIIKRREDGTELKRNETKKRED